MPRSLEQLEQAAAETEAWLDSLDPAELADPANDASDLRRIALAIGASATAEREIADAVAAARAHGRSWGMIAIALGVSRQSARERFEQRSPRGQA